MVMFSVGIFTQSYQTLANVGDFQQMTDIFAQRHANFIKSIKHHDIAIWIHQQNDWLVTTVSPDKHMGYAVQWFLMAFAVLIAFGYFTLRSPVRDEETR